VWQFKLCCTKLKFFGGVVVNENNEIEQENKVDGKRRSFAKAGIAAPVIMTLASRPVFGAQCLSNIMSGNLSNPGSGSCVLGNSPGGWGQPGGKTRDDFSFTTWTGYTLSSQKHEYQWPTGHIYGYLSSAEADDPRGGGVGNQCGDYTGGTLYSAVFGHEPLDSTFSGKSMREILCDGNGSEDWHLVAAMLNAHHYENYILTVQQVIDLRVDPGSYPAGFTSLNSFLDYTWKML